MSAPLNGFTLIAAIPMFAGDRVKFWYVVVDRGAELAHDRYVVAHTTDLTAPAWAYSYGYHDTLKPAMLDVYAHSYLGITV